MVLPEFMGPQLENMWVYEPVNVEALCALLEDGDLMARIESCRDYKTRNREQLRTRLRAYIAKVSHVADAGRCVKVKYKHDDSMEFGRLTPVGPSLQNFPRPVRHVASHGKLSDVDIECCHPTLNWQYLRKLGMDEKEYAPIRAYAENSKETRLTISEDLGITVEQAKTLLQRVSNGGAAVVEHNDEEVLDARVDHPVLRALSEAAGLGVKLICERNPSVLQLCIEQGRKYPELSCASLVMQGLECACLRPMYAAAKKQALVPRTPMHDGFMPQACPTEDDLVQMQAAVLRATGFVVRITTKDVPHYTIEALRAMHAHVELPPPPPPETEQNSVRQCADLSRLVARVLTCDASALSADSRACDGRRVKYSLTLDREGECPHGKPVVGKYRFHLAFTPDWSPKCEADVKVLCGCGAVDVVEYADDSEAVLAVGEWNRREQALDFTGDITDCDRVLVFTRDHAVCMQDAVCYTFRGAHEAPFVHSNAQFDTAYSNLPPVVVGPVRLTPTTTPFTCFWMKHVSRRTHGGMQCIPPPLPVPPDTYNTWCGLRAERLLGKYEYSQAKVDRMIFHNSVLVDHNADCLNFQLQWQAQIIQRPGVLSGVAIVTQGKQGCRKTVYVDEFFGALVVGRRFFSACNAKTAFGHFNAKQNGKVLVSLPEVKCSETYEYAEAIKKIITDKVKELTFKGVDTGDVANFTRLWGVANPSSSGAGAAANVQSGEAERRMWLVRASDELIGNEKYFNEFWKLIEDEQAIMSWFMYLRDLPITISNFQGARPKTELYKEALQANTPHYIQVLHSIVASDVVQEPTVEITARQFAELVSAYKIQVIRAGANAKATNHNATGKMLVALVKEAVCNAGVKYDSGVTYVHSKSSRHYAIDRLVTKTFLEVKYGVDDDMTHLNADMWPISSHLKYVKNELDHLIEIAQRRHVDQTEALVKTGPSEFEVLSMSEIAQVNALLQQLRDGGDIRKHCVQRQT